MILHQFASANLCLCVKLLRQLILPTFPLNYLSQLQLKSFSQTAFASLLGKPGKVSSDVLSNDCLTLIQNRLCFSPDILGIIRKVVEVGMWMWNNQDECKPLLPRRAHLFMTIYASASRKHREKTRKAARIFIHWLFNDFLSGFLSTQKTHRLCAIKPK